MEKFFRTHEVAEICQVAQGTVIRWIKEGKLPAAATAGGHNRILAKDLRALLQSLHLPVPAELAINVSSDQKVRVLIVDDEPEVRKMIRWMVEKEFPGSEVEEAGEGFVAGWKANAFLPNLVVLDLMLPGLNGFQVCQFIRQFQELKHTKIIAISALMDPQAGKKVMSIGADDFLTKPFDLEVLKQKMCILLNKDGKADAAA